MGGDQRVDGGEAIGDFLLLIKPWYIAEEAGIFVSIYSGLKPLRAEPESHPVPILFRKRNWNSNSGLLLFIRPYPN
ncbi:MAG: hypothetical protein R3F44_16070 [Candidatus Competibacteraceae bacterium]